MIFRYQFLSNDYAGLKGIQEKSEFNTLGYSAVINQLKTLLSFNRRNGLQCCIVEYIRGILFQSKGYEMGTFFLIKSSM